MPALTDQFDLSRLALRAGQARRLDLAVALEAFELGAERYAVAPAQVPLGLDVSRMTGGGWSLRLRFRAELCGPCMRCLADASPAFDIDAREVEQPGGGPELESPYVDKEILDLRAWSHDALALALPQQMLCRPECGGLCPICGADLNKAGPEHRHESEPDPRWAALRELKLE